MAAPKGNRFALGHHFGRPPHYDTPDKLLEKCMEYFDSCTNKTGRCTPTITGLTFHVGFSSRASWDDYAKRGDDFSYVVKRVKMFVESCYEQNMHSFNWSGSAFVLKNMNSKDWKDKSEQEVTQTITKVTFIDGDTNSRSEANDIPA